HSSLSSLLHHPRSTLLPYTTLFRSQFELTVQHERIDVIVPLELFFVLLESLKILNPYLKQRSHGAADNFRMIYIHSRPNNANISDRKSTRLNSSHVKISYAVFCLKK